MIKRFALIKITLILGCFVPVDASNARQAPEKTTIKKLFVQNDNKFKVLFYMGCWVEPVGNESGMCILSGGTGEGGVPVAAKKGVQQIILDNIQCVPYGKTPTFCYRALGMTGAYKKWGVIPGSVGKTFNSCTITITDAGKNEGVSYSHRCP